MIFILQFSCALILDALFGDPEWFPHPVRIIGKFCGWYERVTRAILQNELFAGAITVVLVILTTVVCLGGVLFVAHQVDPVIGAALAVFFLYTSIAIRDLLRHSKAVYTCLFPEVKLTAARKAVGMIVGRDTAHLDEAAISRACVETVAENMVDGITAPLFYGGLGSCLSSSCGIAPIYGAALGAMVYKSINTMDSMLGYKNERYLYFGRVAAKLDDLVNWLPARLSGACVIFAAFLCKLDYRKAAMVYKRDRMNHSSPNAGHTEAAIAGILGVQLGGPSYYFGSQVVKPYLGDPDRPIIAGDILLANKIVIAGTALFYSGLMALVLVLALLS